MIERYILIAAKNHGLHWQLFFFFCSLLGMLTVVLWKEQKAHCRMYFLPFLIAWNFCFLFCFSSEKCVFNSKICNLRKVHATENHIQGKW